MESVLHGPKNLPWFVANILRTSNFALHRHLSQVLDYHSFLYDPVLLFQESQCKVCLVKTINGVDIQQGVPTNFL